MVRSPVIRSATPSLKGIGRNGGLATKKVAPKKTVSPATTAKILVLDRPKMRKSEHGMDQIEEKVPIVRPV
jgi:hypothetical protein